jgi:hypothetical protein
LAQVAMRAHEAAAEEALLLGFAGLFARFGLCVRRILALLREQKTQEVERELAFGNFLGLRSILLLGEPPHGRELA